MAGATTWWKAYKEVFQKETIAQLLFGLHKKYGEIEEMVNDGIPNKMSRRSRSNRSE